MFNFRKIFDKKALVLMYHRVAATEMDPWELAVDPVHFEEQLNVLKHYNVVSLNELVTQVKHGKIKKNCILITFDDGYIDNFLIAKPLLTKYNIPATFFITSKNIEKKKEFWWDELAFIILKTQKLPEAFHIKWKNAAIDFDLGEEAELTGELQDLHRKFSIYKSFPTRRAQLYYNLWEQMHPMTDPDQEDFLARIRSWADVTSSNRPEFACMSAFQISELHNNDLFTIGGHTTTHPALSFHDKRLQYKEIRENRLFLEKITGAPIRYFAYPSGKFSEDTIAAVQDAGFEASVTTDHKPISNTVNLFSMGRFQVNNWGKATFKKKLDQWFRQ